MTGCDSLRDICLCLAVHSPIILHPYSSGGLSPGR
ncbi:hypothetical protein [uncultured Duncaniella sp.]|nr:hypothetical protein [uncultured Duncaniella sp.]